MVEEKLPDKKLAAEELLAKRVAEGIKDEDSNPKVEIFIPGTQIEAKLKELESEASKCDKQAQELQRAQMMIQSQASELEKTRNRIQGAYAILKQIQKEISDANTKETANL
jgi:septal ring factor EnvC (AmiA/AmiB activator)